MTSFRLLLITTTTLAAAFVPQHRVAWSLRNSPKLAVSTSTSKTLGSSNRNSTAATIYYPDQEEQYFDEQKNHEQLQQLQKLEELVVTPELYTPHTEDTSSTSLTSTTTSDAVVSKEEEGFLSVVWRARLLLLGAAALYGTNFSIIKLMGDTMPVGISATLRFGLAAVATLPWLLAPPKDGSPLIPTSFGQKSAWETVKSLASTSTVGAALAGFEVGLWNSVGYLAQAVGLETTDASKSAFICSLAVVIVPIMDFLSGKRLLSREVVGAVMAVAGVGVLEFGGDVTDLTLSSGDIASLLQPIMFGVAFWRMETAMRKYPEEANRSTAAQLLAVFLASAGYCFSTCDVDWNQVQAWLVDPMIMGALFFTGIITTALTIYMETVALKTLTAAETTLILSTEPLWGAGFASILIGEQFGMDAAIGATLILAGCVFSNLGVEGIRGLLGSKHELPPDKEIDDNSDEIVDTEVAKRALVDLGMIGLLVRFVAFLEMDMIAASSAALVGEEIAEEVIKDVL